MYNYSSNKIRTKLSEIPAKSGMAGQRDEGRGEGMAWEGHDNCAVQFIINPLPELSYCHQLALPHCVSTATTTRNLIKGQTQTPRRDTNPPEIKCTST